MSEVQGSLRNKSEFGYIESAQRLMQPGSRTWNQQKLLKAAESAQLRNTGWPMGLVIHQQGLAPVPTTEGIEARLGHYDGIDWQDYWAFQKDGGYYVVRLFEEDFDSPSFTTSRGHPAKSIWFDVRIWRMAEVILHSASLYRALGLPPDEPYLLTVNHGGLANREFWASRMNWFVKRGRVCQTPTVNWTRELTQDYVLTDLKALVGEVAESLFVLFDFARVARPEIDGIVDTFLGSRL